MTLGWRQWALITTLGLGCGWLRFVPERPRVERKVAVPFGEPGRVDLISLRGAWLRAAELASASYFGGLVTPPDPTPLESCLLSRENYDLEVWEQQEPADGGEADAAAGRPDAGSIFDAAVPRLLFVTIILHWDACDLGESPPTDLGGNYAIDTTTSQIVGWR